MPSLHGGECRSAPLDVVAASVRGLEHDARASLKIVLVVPEAQEITEFAQCPFRTRHERLLAHLEHRGIS
jgi:hypothetical protein